MNLCGVGIFDEKRSFGREERQMEVELRYFASCFLHRKLSQ
jgi:hypothetical protein